MVPIRRCGNLTFRNPRDQSAASSPSATDAGPGDSPRHPPHYWARTPGALHHPGDFRGFTTLVLTLERKVSGAAE